MRTPDLLSPQLATVGDEPYYQPVGEEVALFETAYRRRLPVLLKGPTGCGKTRFVEYMAWRLKRPLVTVACHDDLTTADLVGRYLIVGEQTVWMDGPLTAAVRAGAICYLDEIVEARKDTTVVIHPLTDSRRVLAVDKRGELVPAPDDFMLVISYNPGYQSVLKEIKPSTRQRFVALEFDYPSAEVETGIVATEGGVDAAFARKAGQAGGTDPQSEGPGPRRGRQYPPAGACGAVGQRRHGAGLGLHGRHRPSADRRPGHERNAERPCPSRLLVPPESFSNTSWKSGSTPSSSPRPRTARLPGWRERSSR